MRTANALEPIRAALLDSKYSAPIVSVWRAGDWIYDCTQTAGGKSVKIPESKPMRFALFYASEMASFFIISVNGIALIHGSYVLTVVTDMILVFQGMIVSKLMIEDEKSRDWTSIWGFTYGGATGSALAIFAMKHLWR